MSSLSCTICAARSRSRALGRLPAVLATLALANNGNVLLGHAHKTDVLAPIQAFTVDLLTESNAHEKGRRARAPAVRLRRLTRSKYTINILEASQRGVTSRRRRAQHTVGRVIIKRAGAIVGLSRSDASAMSIQSA